MLMMTLMTPLLYVLLFAPLLQHMYGSTASALDHFMPGLIILTAFTAGMGTGWYVVDDVKSGVIARFKVSPASGSAYLWGCVLADAATFLIPTAILVGVGVLMGYTIHWGGLAASAGLGLLFTFMYSMTTAGIGLALKNTGAVGGIVSGIQLPVMLLSGVMLPISFGPH
jgi:ABC-2 type transport system permease protein